MANGIFAELEVQELLNLRKFAQRAPKQFNRVAVGVVNSGAFGTRREALAIMKSRMIIRNERFLNSTVRTQKAKTSVSVDQAQAITGSVARDRFTGWEEQEHGGTAKKTRTTTVFGRDLNPFKVMPVGNRLKRSSILSPDDFPGTSENHRSLVMINSLRRRGYTRTFIVKGNRKFKTGLYRFDSRKKIRRVQSFSQSITPPRIKWLSGGGATYFKKNKPSDVWAKEIKFTLRLK